MLPQAVRVVRVVPGHRVHDVGRVLHRARDAAFERKQARRGKRRRPGDARQAARRALEAVRVGPRRRDAQRPATVRALSPRHEPIGNGRGGAAGRPAAILRQVPRVTRRAVQVVVARAAKAQRRAIRLADRDGAGALHAQREVAGAVDNVVAHGADAAVRALPAGQRVREVLNRRRQPGQRREVLFRQQAALGLLRLAVRVLLVEVDESAERRVAPLDTRQRRVQQLYRRKRLRPQQSAKLRDRLVSQLIRISQGSPPQTEAILPV